MTASADRTSYPLDRMQVGRAHLACPQPSTPGNVYHDPNGTTTVRYIDFSQHAGGLVRFHATQAMRFLWVESDSPTTTPTTAAAGTQPYGGAAGTTSTEDADLNDAVMDRIPANFPIEQPVDPRTPVLAYILEADGAFHGARA